MPKRMIAGQATKLSRAMHSIQYDDVHDEMIIANPFAQAILIYRGGANGEEPPIRVIQGPHTQMMDPEFGVDVDPVHDELFVVEADYILVYSRTGNGDVAPLRVIRGPHTQLNQTARGLSVDPVHDLLVVTSEDHRHGQILIFNRTDHDDAKPQAVIVGLKTGIGPHINNLRVYPAKGWIISNLVAPREQGERAGIGESAGIAVWSIHDNGDVPPRWLLGGPKSEVRGTRIAVNPKTKEVIIGGGSTLRTYYFPEVF